MAKQFLDVITAEQARQLFREHVVGPVGSELIPLGDSLGRILAEDVTASVDVPGFDRANFDGFAVRAADTFGASETEPALLSITAESLAPGDTPQSEVSAGQATTIATGAVLPRGADAVIMIEETDEGAGSRMLEVRRALTPGSGVSFAGSDIARGETVERRGTPLTARETGTLAAIGCTEVTVYRRPRVAIFSTGNEVVTPGGELAVGQVFDSNLRILSDTVREIGCDSVELGVIGDDPIALKACLEKALECDAVLFSGGTSKGKGDYGVSTLKEYAGVEILCHGVAVKPGKPLCLAVCGGKPIAVLPGFPTSCVFTFHEFVAPVLRRLVGAPAAAAATVEAQLPLRINSERGRTEFALVSLLRNVDHDSGGDGCEYVAYPLGKGSGSVTTFAQADGFVTIDRQQEYVDEGERIIVTRLGEHIAAADLVVIGSHCIGLDYLLGLLRDEGFTARVVSVGSHGGFRAAARGECDLGGVHLCNDAGEYNAPFLEDGVRLLRGYERQQGIVSRSGDVDVARDRLVNRNRGSGTRIVIDDLLKTRGGSERPPGYAFEVRSHNAVAAAVAQERADWGVAIANVAEDYSLHFETLRAEQFDFVIPETRWERAAVQRFREILQSPDARAGLEERGFRCVETDGS